MTKNSRINWLSVALAYVAQLGAKGTRREMGETPRAWAQRLAGQAISMREISACVERRAAQRASGEPTTIREVRRRAHRAALAADAIAAP